MESLRNPEVIKLGDEEVWRALLDGQGVVNDFIPPSVAETFGTRLDELFDDEDLDGIPLNSQEEEWEAGEDVIEHTLGPEERETLRQIERLYCAIIARAADVDEAMLENSISELLKYVSTDMPFHMDQYEVNEDDPGYLRDMRVLNGILTLKGRANYQYKDPATGKIETILTKPGTLVITRSGDIDALPQVEHGVGSPLPTEDGEPENRIVLLLAFNRIPEATS